MKLLMNSDLESVVSELLNLWELKELRHDILSQFFDGVNCGLRAGKPKNNGLLRKKNNKGLILRQKGTRMDEDGED